MLLRMSTLFVRTLREDPADAEVPSHRLLVRAGYIRRAAPGIYTWLPLGLRVLAKVEQVVREEMDGDRRAGGALPGAAAARAVRAHRAVDRVRPQPVPAARTASEADYLLAPTHEEMFTLLVKDLYSSYKDLPLALYQIQTKYRDEARPRAGLLRGREFIMKDAYSFDVDDAGLDAAYQRQREAYQRIFTRLGLEYVIVCAMSGAMGGSRSEEFLMPTPIGEDTFVRSPRRVRRERRGGHHPGARGAAVRRRTGGARRGHPGHPDHRHARRARQRALRAARPALDRGGHAQERRRRGDQARRGARGRRRRPAGRP